MSVGMNVLFSIVGKVAAMLGDKYDIEIVEEHHNKKKDAPSGSALTLASFVKLLHSVFLSRRPAECDQVREVPFLTHT